MSESLVDRRQPVRNDNLSRPVGRDSPRHLSAMKDEHCPRCGQPCKWMDDNCWYRCQACMLSFKFSADARTDGYVSYDSKLRENHKANLSCLAMRTGARAYRGNFPKLARIWFWLSIRLELLCTVLFRLDADKFIANRTITADTDMPVLTRKPVPKSQRNLAC